MASTPTSVVLDDREEGEIVDDDFEDISDNSIIVPIYSGKSVSSKEHLPAISLSSVTDTEEPKCEEKLRRRQKSTRRRTSKSYKKRRSSHRKSVCNDSDSDDDYLALDRKLQKQLKAAIRVDNVECHRNSLRTRLRAMTKLDHDSDIEKNSDNNNKIVEKVSSDEGDSELKELRMEALRSTMLNKCMHRKKRKVKEMQDGILSDISIKTDTSETNKENTHNANENVNVRLEESSKKLCVEKPVENNENKIEITNNIVENSTLPEDDEDVLRALLLASISKKITKEPDVKETILPSPNSNQPKDKIKQTLNPKNLKNEVKNITVKNIQNFNLKKRVIKNNIVLTNNQPVQLPKVKPLIININTDSDTDEEAFNLTVKNTPNCAIEVKKINLDIENTVDKFLKEQRAKVEAQLSPIAEHIPIPNTPAITNKSVILEKSSVKLLPKERQIEYQNLLQRINNAEKRPRIRRSSYKLNSDGKSAGIPSKKFVRTKVPVNKQLNNVPKADQVPDIRSDVRTLHKTLKEIQVQKNGRLQIQEKYKVLKPIIKTINEVSIDRKKYDEDVKRLLEELAEVKKKLHKSHQDFTAHVKELVQRKEDLDKSPEIPTVVEDPKTRFTSTPIKEKPPFESFDASSIPSTTPKNTHPPPENVDTNVAVGTVGIRKEEEIVDANINPGDPNDIDKIYNIQKNSIPKYISPLGNVKRVAMDDPFSIVCPYDVDGNCRDPECIYKHLLK